MWWEFCKTLPCLFQFSPGPVTSSTLLLSLFIHLVLWIPYLSFCDSRERQPPARSSQGSASSPFSLWVFPWFKKISGSYTPSSYHPESWCPQCKVKDRTESSTFSKIHDGCAQLPTVAPESNSTCAANFNSWWCYLTHSHNRGQNYCFFNWFMISWNKKARSRATMKVYPNSKKLTFTAVYNP